MLSIQVTRRWRIKPLLFLFLITLLSVPAFATVYNVNNTTDGNGLNQLRGAIVAADAAGPGPHTINVAAGTYTLTLGTIIFGNNPQTINIVGAGAASTIISMTTGAARDRIFLINPTAFTNSPVISISGVTFQNGYLTSDTFGGGAIYAGGGAAESLTLTNCAFVNNTTPALKGGGAAVKFNPRGNLTVDNCTFTSNLSNDADGAAILFQIESGGAGTGFGTLNVTNSTFTGNTINNPTSNADGGAISIRGQGGVSAFNATVNNNTFINNSADQFGGAIIAVNSAALSILQIHFNRFINNTSGLSASTSGLYTAGAGDVNADNNWWGCNTGPSAVPCNQASSDVGGGALILTKWLQLKTTASPSSIVTNQTSSLTASFLSNSANEAITAANASRLIGLPVTWSSLGGGLSSQQATIQATGTATATYSETSGVAGTHSATAVVDSAPASGSVNTAAITVGKANTTAAITTNLTTPTVTGQSYTVAYTVTGAFGNSPTAPTGNVQVSDGASTCTGTVAAGSCSLTSTTAGAKTITATYLSGDANFNASPASAGVAHTVNKASTTASIGTDTPDPSNVGQNVTVTYSVAVTSPGAGTPGGNVQVSDGVNSCTGTVAAGQCTLALSTAGSRNITATYQGDANFNASPASANAPHVVGQVTWTGATDTNFATNTNWNTGLAPGTADTVVIPLGAPNQPNLSAASTTVANLTVSAGGTLTISGNKILTVNGTLTMSGNNIDATAGTLEIGGAGTVVRTSGVVLGNMRKVVTSAPFAPESPAFVFVYPVGTATGFSPVTANVTAGAGSLTVFAKDGTAPATPGLNDATTLDRYWTLTETGAITADLTFQYLNTDVDGNEANYRMIRSNGTSAVSFPNACPGSPCVTPAADTIFAAGVQSFDNHWTAGEPVAPTASSASVSGQVFDSNGRGSYGSFVSITDSRGNVKIAITNPFGYFSFTGLQTGQSYVISVRDKRRQYESRVINLTDDATGVDFMPVN